MVNINVETNQTYSAIGHTDDVQITVKNGAVLTIDTDTARIEDLICTTLGTFLIRNTSAVTPIFIDIGDEATAAIRIEKGGVLDIQGAWITLGTSTGGASQTFTLPTNLAGDKYKSLGGIEVVTPTGAILLYNRVDSLTGKRGNLVYGLNYTHDVASGLITFGDGAEGYIPPSGSTIRIPNIQIQDSSSGSNYTDFDLAVGGTFKSNIASFSSNFDFDLRNASTIELRHTTISKPKKQFHIVGTSNIILESIVLETDYSLGVYSLSCNNMLIDGFNLYMRTTSTNHCFELRSSNDGIARNVTVHRPNSFYGHYRAGIYHYGNGFLFEDIYITCSTNCFENSGSNNTYRRCFVNNAQSPTLNNGIYSGFYLVAGANLFYEDCGSYPMSYAEGGVPPRNNFYNCTAYAKNVTITGGAIYAGSDSEAGRLYSAATVAGPNVRINDIDVYGDFKQGVIDIQYSGKDCELSNIRTHGTSQSLEQFDWASGCKANLVTMPQNFYHNTVSADPDDVGADCASFLSYNKDDQTTGVLTRIMGEDINLGFYEELTKTGVIAFDNSSYMYIHNVGDSVTLETHVHHGILSFTSNSHQPSNVSSNYTIEFAMRNPDGVYGGFSAFTFGNMNTALAALTDYDPAVGLQIKFKFTKSSTDISKAVAKVYMEVTLDETVRAPFEVTPTYFVVSGLEDGDSVYVQDASNNKKLFEVSDGSDITLQLPNANANEYWKYVIKRPGYHFQGGTFKIVVGNDVGITQGMTEKLQAIGGSMYTGSDVLSTSIRFDHTTPQLSIDVSQPEINPQNLFDKFERALATEDGMKWLAMYGTNIEYQNLGGAGAFLFEEGNIRIRRAALENDNAGINAYVFSTDGTPVDEVNGTVALFSGTLVKDILLTDLDVYDDEDGTVGNVLSKILRAAELSAALSA